MDNFDMNLIDQYVLGQLPPKEAAEVTQKIKIDTVFAAKVELHQLAINGIEEYNLQQIEKNIQNVDSQLDQEGLFITTADMDTYIDGKASADISDKIDQRLVNDTPFKADFELHQLARQGIEQKAADDSFANLFENIDKNLAQEGFFETAPPQNKVQEKQTTAKIRRFPFRPLAIAASFALAIFAGWWLINQNTSTLDSQTLYATHFQLLPDEISTELEDVGFVKPVEHEYLEDAMSAYNQQHFSQAIQSFKKYQTTTNATDDFYGDASLYLAISLLKENQITEAQSLLLPLSKQTSSLQNKAKWYLALSYLKGNQALLAIPVLKSLEGSDYEVQASKLLEELE